MQIVIDIPNFAWIENIKDFKSAVEEYEMGSGFDNAIREALVLGTPLPEHHGRLIDADWVKNTLDIYVINEYNGQFIRRSDIDTIPTIIEGSESE